MIAGFVQVSCFVVAGDCDISNKNDVKIFEFKAYQRYIYIRLPVLAKEAERKD